MKKYRLWILCLVTAISLSINGIAVAEYGIQTKTSGCTANQILPDSACTPGAVLTTDTKIVCKSGYTKTVRNVSTSVKKRVFAEYGIPYSKRGNYEVDHLISLELGGSNDISNLWPENSLIKNGSKSKDQFENYLHKQVCNGSMTLEEAQKQISDNWVQNYKDLSAGKSQPKKDTKSETSTPAIPNGATALCKDGTYSFSATKSGSCSHHGGVANWLK